MDLEYYLKDKCNFSHPAEVQRQRSILESSLRRQELDSILRLNESLIWLQKREAVWEAMANRSV